MTQEVRVRFAPSPTGYLHIGGVRTALYNYLFAKKNKGSLILRIEDTDRNRYVADAEQYINESLEYCGIHLDESIVKGGDYGPYRQSERRDQYQTEVLKLVENGSAYYAFDTPEEIEEKRKSKEHWQYSSATRSEMKNSLTLDESATKKWLKSEKPYTIRFKMPENETVSFTDIIRGEVSFNTSQLDDKVLLKEGGMPTYHLANICDDYAMKISHVIRGEEWLSSTPLHVLIYRAFGWEAPKFAHLPLILKPDGKGKLSKRDGEAHGFPVFPIKWFNEEKQLEQPGFREIDFIPDAFNNMLAFLGWNPGTEQELMSMNELIENFDLEKVHKAGARFDWEKAKWFNQQYLLKMEDHEIAAILKERYEVELCELDNEQLINAVAMVKERMIFYSDFMDQASFLCRKPKEFDEKNIKKKYKAENAEHFNNLIDHFEKLESWEESDIESSLKDYLTTNDLGFGAILPGFRLMLTGKMGGPSIFAIAEFIGKSETIERMKSGIEYFGSLIS